MSGEDHTFLHCGGGPPDPGSCSPAGRLQPWSGTGPPCRPHDSAAPSAAVADTVPAQVKSTPDNTAVKGRHRQVLPHAICILPSCQLSNVCAYLSLHGILVQLQVLFGGSLLHQLGAQLIDLVSAPAHSVCQYLQAASLFLQLQVCSLQLVLAKAKMRAKFHIYAILQFDFIGIFRVFTLHIEEEREERTDL